MKAPAIKLFIMLHLTHLTIVGGQVSLIINEVHPMPVAGEPEWVELYNAGDAPIEAAGWMVCDATQCITIPHIVILPGAYAVLTRDSTALREARSAPAAAMYVEVKLPTLNNTVDEVKLRTPDSALVDSVRYSMAWGRPGISLERRDPMGRAADATNWSPSIAPDSATCGYINSHIRLQRDLRILSIEPIAASSTVRITADNFGMEAMTAERLTIAIGGHILTTRSPGLLQPDERYIIELQTADIAIAAGAPGRTLIEAWLTVTDDRQSNNGRSAWVDLPPPPGTITITEVMFDPMPDQNDYVEIYNATDYRLDPTSWKLSIGDRGRKTDTLTIAHTNLAMPHAHWVVGVDTNFLWMVRHMDRPRAAVAKSLWNIPASGGRITLLNGSGYVLDSITVDARQHTVPTSARKGTSLERTTISGQPDLWTSCGDLSGGTPGRENASQATPGETLTIEAHPNPFSSVPGNHRHPLTIAYRLPYRQATLHIRIYDRISRMVRHLVNAAYSSALGTQTWDGTDYHGNRLPPGPYIMTIEALDLTGPRTTESKHLLVIGE